MSAGLSVILNERRNCLRGRWLGAEIFRTCPLPGDPERSWPINPCKGDLSFGGPKSEDNGEFADCGRFSGDGDEVRPSLTANNGVGPGSLGPKLKLRGCVSSLPELSVIAVVENPFLKVGLHSDDFLRLN